MRIIKLQVIISILILIFLFPRFDIVDAKPVQSPGNEKSLLESTNQVKNNSRAEQFVSIDFNDVDIKVFIKFISELTGKNFIVDHRVKGKVTIISPSKISVKEAYKVFESVLDVHGFATVKAGEVIKIVSSPSAKTMNVETLLKREASSAEDKVVTQIIRLNYANPDEIKRLLSPLISKNSVMLAYSPTNTLIVTDMYSNIKRLIKIIKNIDVTGIGNEISIIPLEFADSKKFLRTLESIFKSSGKSKAKSRIDTARFVSDERTNTIIVLANQSDTERVKRLIRILDKAVPRGKEKIHVYYLENATAEDLAKVLQSLSSKPGASEKGKKAPIVSGSVKITADKSTNSLIIMAEKEDYLVLEEIIKKLDIPRSMVYIECLIMEVNVDKGLNLGAEWVSGSKVSHNGTDGAAGGGFNAGTGNLAGISGVNSANASILPLGFSLGIFGEVLKIGDVSFPSLGAVIQAYQKDKDVHILSTPQILTTDNEEATITVGRNIPYMTKTESTSTSDYQNFEYKDVGLSLKITPQINKDKLVRLKIIQVVERLDLSAMTTSLPTQPTTLKRTVDTTVIVQDNNTVVIGGLIDDMISDTQYKVPCFGDLPGVGLLFKSVGKSRERTNLYVFLTPRVISDKEDIKQIYTEKKDKIDRIKEGNIKMYEGNEK
ncbi:MAG: type II secretion system secretin GspD [Desulfobacterales bacterium]|jgi:general secretion pathway protein D|nr:type II secretion system secretin GspD [Desulfobacteraceae bacterium]MBT4364928.1 type II secretion system secretin GspD [Desulfobacteraceae bacterium]MBT7084557.1 type II secretion system secretin GspD [Desulfobacterales bacterium]MBT7697203.1 type II secretion system secretin GspD [Desulfobacterales bacterium]